MNNCIGKRNFRTFNIFLFFASLGGYLVFLASIWGIFVEMQDLPKDEMKSVGFLLIFQAAIMIMALKYEYILNRCFDYFGFEIDVTLRRIIILGACLVITCTPLTIYTKAF